MTTSSNRERMVQIHVASAWDFSLIEDSLSNANYYASG